MNNFISKFIKIPQEFPFPVKILLFCSMGRALVVFTLLPFLPIYLTKVLEQSVDEVGYLLGICLFCGTIVSVYGGYLADKIKKFKFICGLVIWMACLSFLLSIVQNILLVLLLLILFNTCSSSMGVTSNALLSELLSSEERNKAFSLRYTLENMGAAIGPFLGTWAVRYNNNGPFILAGLFALFILGILIAFRNEYRHLPILIEKTAPSEPLNFAKTLKILQLDKRLVLFTMGGILSMAVYGPLLTYLSQYLVVTKTVSLAYQTIAYVSAANALVVICLQYIIGSHIKKELLMRWLTLGIMAFVVGLLCLSLSLQLLPWMIAIVIFTLGEIIIVPAEYMFVDLIAPEHLKGIYFGAQNLIFLGMALGPMLCGNLLKYTEPQVMFYALMGVTLLSWIFYYLGYYKHGLNPAVFNVKPNTTG
jgi:MFS family permease